MRYRLRTLLISVAILPPILAPLGVWGWHQYVAWYGRQSAFVQPIHGYLGAELFDEGLMNQGVQVAKVRPGAPAETGGLIVGDLITAFNSKRCRNLDDFDAVLAKLPPGSKVPLVVRRGDLQKSLVVTLGKRPQPALRNAPLADPIVPQTLLEHVEQNAQRQSAGSQQVPTITYDP